MAKDSPSKVTWAQAIRDILIASMNSGQFLTALIALTFIVIILRLPENEVTSLVHEIINVFANWRAIGYFLTPAAIIAWGIHVRILRRYFKDAIERSANELSYYQQKAIGDGQVQDLKLVPVETVERLLKDNAPQRSHKDKREKI